MRGTRFVTGLGGVALAMSTVAIMPASSASANSGSGGDNGTQILLSATGVPTVAGPAGFWLWSQPNDPNAYGNDGAGNVYFYAQGVTLPVDVSDVFVSGNTVSEDVEGSSPIGTSVTCSLTATETRPGSGLISFNCSGVGVNGPFSGSATNAPGQVTISTVSGK